MYLWAVVGLSTIVQVQMDVIAADLLEEHGGNGRVDARRQSCSENPAVRVSATTKFSRSSDPEFVMEAPFGVEPTIYALRATSGIVSARDGEADSRGGRNTVVRMWC